MTDQYPEVPLAKTLVVTEIFKSIQGESTWVGLPCIFVRLTGCSLRCDWCDTEHAFEGGRTLTVDEILTDCEVLGGNLVEITGGEPLLQAGCATLAQCLLDQGMTVLCETNGSLPIDRLPAAVIKIMDIKCPGSGMSDANDWDNIERLSKHDEVKFVIADREDYEWARDVISQYGLPGRCRQVLLSPVLGSMGFSDLAEWILEDGLNVRFQLQLHKHIWPAERQGV